MVEELLDHAAENVCFRQRGNLVAELKLVKDLLDIGREAIEIGFQVCLELLGLGTGSKIT